VQHTPSQTAGYSDAELITIFTEGKKPEGEPQRYTFIPKEYWNMGHRWNVTEEQKKGLVVYLRALAPKGQENVDTPPGVKRFLDGGTAVELDDGAIIDLTSRLDGGTRR
jgi:hypothetical protein